MTLTLHFIWLAALPPPSPSLAQGCASQCLLRCLFSALTRTCGEAQGDRREPPFICFWRFCCGAPLLVLPSGHAPTHMNARSRNPPREQERHPHDVCTVQQTLPLLHAHTHTSSSLRCFSCGCCPRLLLCLHVRILLVWNAVAGWRADQRRSGQLRMKQRGKLRV